MGAGGTSRAVCLAGSPSLFPPNACIVSCISVLGRFFNPQRDQRRLPLSMRYKRFCSWVFAELVFRNACTVSCISVLVRFTKEQRCLPLNMRYKRFLFLGLSRGANFNEGKKNLGLCRDVLVHFINPQ